MHQSTKSKGTWVAILLVFVVTLVFSGCAATGGLIRGRGGSKGVVVVASGEAPVDPRDLLGTKKRALLEAQRNAVEMAAGVHVSGKTVVEKSMAVSTSLVSVTDGYIDSFKVLSEKLDGELYTVKIKARVRIEE